MVGLVSKSMLVIIASVGVAWASTPVASAQLARSAAAQGARINEAAFMEFVLQRSGGRADPGMRQRAASTRLTGEQRRQLATVLRDARSAAAASVEIANDLSEASPTSTDAASSIQAAAGALAGAASQQDYLSLSDSVTQLEQALATAGDDAQLADVDLQNTLQKQQQTLQMLSNVSRMMNDTAMGIIRNIGG